MNMGQRHHAYSILAAAVALLLVAGSAFAAGEGDVLPELRLANVSNDQLEEVAAGFRGAVGAIAYMPQGAHGAEGLTGQVSEPEDRGHQC